MIGMTIQVEMNDGEVHEVPVTYGVACKWEDHHPTLSWSSFLEDPKFKPMAYLAWEAVKAAGIPVKLFTPWLDTIAGVKFIPKDRAEKQDKSPD
jgi:hypothetical protein